MKTLDIIVLLAIFIPFAIGMVCWIISNHKHAKMCNQEWKKISMESALAEREACAAVCDGNLKTLYLTQGRPGHDEALLVAATDDCAAAIRTR